LTRDMERISRHRSTSAAGRRSYWVRPALYKEPLCRAVRAIPETNYGIRLRALLALDDIELDLIAFFERLVSVQLNRRVVNEYIWSVFASDESVALSIVKPLHLTFVLSHRFLPSLLESCRVLVIERGKSFTVTFYDAENRGKVDPSAH